MEITSADSLEPLPLVSPILDSPATHKDTAMSDPIVFEPDCIINSFQCGPYTGHASENDARPSKWNEDKTQHSRPLPACWEVTLGNSPAYRTVCIPRKRCKTLEKAIRLAMSLIPFESITMYWDNGERYGKRFFLVGSDLVDWERYLYPV